MITLKKRSETAKTASEDMKEEDANELGAKIEETYPDVEVEVHYGGQPIYYYVLSVE